MFEGKVECQKCHKVWTIPQASPGVYCNCHLWCQYGTKPSDCNLTDAYYEGSQGWPVGSDQNPKNEGEKVWERTKYCSVHEVYSTKIPMWLEVNWERWYQKRRLPRKFRELQKR